MSRYYLRVRCVSLLYLRECVIAQYNISTHTQLRGQRSQAAILSFGHLPLRVRLQHFSIIPYHTSSHITLPYMLHRMDGLQQSSSSDQPQDDLNRFFATQVRFMMLLVHGVLIASKCRFSFRLNIEMRRGLKATI